MYSPSEIKALNELSESLVQGLVPDEVEQAIDVIRKVIRYHDWRYYSISEPIIVITR